MRVSPGWAAGTLGLLLGVVLLVGLTSGGAASRLPQVSSGWHALLWLVCGGLLGMAGAAFVAGFRRRPEHAAPSRPDGQATADALRALLDVSPQAIVAIDSAGTVTMWSPAAASILGWAPEEVLARPLPVVVEDGPAGARPLRQALGEGRPWRGTMIRSRRKDGTALGVRVWAAAVDGAARSPAGFVLAIEEASAGRPAAAEGGPPGVSRDAVNALYAAALGAADLFALLEAVAECTRSALGASAGGAWVEQMCAAHGLAADLPAAIGQAARAGVSERPGCLAVADWNVAPAEDLAGVRERLLQQGIRASLITSFISKRGHAGGIVVASPEPRPWTPHDCALIEAAGEILAEAADRLSLLGETQQRLELLDRTHAIGKRLNHPAPVIEVAKIIGEGAVDLARSNRAAVYVPQPDGTLTCPWSQNLSAPYVGQVLHHAKLLAAGRVMDGAKPDLLEISGRGIDASAPVFYSDVASLPPAVQIPRLVQTEGYRALSNWPLVHEGQVLGLLSCYDDAPRTWSAPEKDALQLFAQEAAFALHNAHLHDAQAQRTADLEVLFDLSRRLRAARNLAEIYPILVGHAVDLLHADCGVLALLGERQEFECVLATGIASEVRGASFPISGSPFGRVMQTGAMYQTMNFGGEPLPVWMNGLRGIGPMAIVPVRSEEETIGVFCLGRTRRSDASAFTVEEVRLFEGIAEIGGTAIRRARLFQNLERSYMQMVVSLVRTMDARDSYTSGHSERISEWAEAVARELACAEPEVQDIRWGALLHDIGKIGVPDAILRKPGKLTDAEWAVMRKHPEIGEEILASTERMRGVATLVRHHQEKWNGTGYPDRLNGEEIPLGARILAVCDAYSAITDDRPYKKARTHDEAVAELRRCAGVQFDPQAVEAFCKVLERERQREHALRPR